MDAAVSGQPAARARIAAAGTLPRNFSVEHPSFVRRLWLITEMVLIFCAAPFAMAHLVYTKGVPLFLALPPVLIGLLIFLLLDRTFAVRRELIAGVRLRYLLFVLLVFLACGGLVAYWVATTMPERFLLLPTQRPDTWLKILALYPFTSVLAQELVYRSFFFHRYGPVFGRHVGLMILVNAIAFGLGHALFRNWIAVGGTALTGLLFAWRYQTTRSFWTVWFEHVLWGYLVFTTGLGVFFFTGVRNPAW